MGRRMTARAADLVDRVLPHVRHRQWVLSVPFWLRWRMAFDHDCTKAVLRIFLRAVFASYRQRAKRAGLAEGRTGAVTVVQRFGSALNLNVHFHSLAPDGVWVEGDDGELTFHPLRGPTDEELEELAALVERRVKRLLVERGLWEDDEDGGVPAAAGELPDLADLYQASVTQRAGSGARRGERVRRVGVTMALEPGTLLGAKARTEGGFDIHAGVTVGAKKRDRLEHIARYLLRPSVANDALERLPSGDVLLKIRRPWSDGTSHVRFTPFELIERLVALVPRPCSNLVLYHGVLAANAKWRERIVPEPSEPPCACASEQQHAPVRPNHTWAELMRRGLEIDSLECPRACGGRLRFVATIETPAVIARLLRHLGLPSEPVRLAPARGPPNECQQGLAP